jgi:hypothetical protein
MKQLYLICTFLFFGNFTYSTDSSCSLDQLIKIIDSFETPNDLSKNCQFSLIYDGGNTKLKIFIEQTKETIVFDIFSHSDGADFFEKGAGGKKAFDDFLNVKLLFELEKNKELKLNKKQALFFMHTLRRTPDFYHFLSSGDCRELVKEFEYLDIFDLAIPFLESFNDIYEKFVVIEDIHNNDNKIDITQLEQPKQLSDCLVYKAGAFDAYKFYFLIDKVLQNNEINFENDISDHLLFDFKLHDHEQIVCSITVDEHTIIDICLNEQFFSDFLLKQHGIENTVFVDSVINSLQNNNLNNEKLKDFLCALCIKDSNFVQEIKNDLIYWEFFYLYTFNLDDWSLYKPGYHDYEKLTVILDETTDEVIDLLQLDFFSQDDQLIGTIKIDNYIVNVLLNNDIFYNLLTQAHHCDNQFFLNAIIASLIFVDTNNKNKLQERLRPFSDKSSFPKEEDLILFTNQFNKYLQSNNDQRFEIEEDIDLSFVSPEIVIALSYAAHKILIKNIFCLSFIYRNYHFLKQSNYLQETSLDDAISFLSNYNLYDLKHGFLYRIISLEDDKPSILSISTKDGHNCVNIDLGNLLNLKKRQKGLVQDSVFCDADSVITMIVNLYETYETFDNIRKLSFREIIFWAHFLKEDPEGKNSIFKQLKNNVIIEAITKCYSLDEFDNCIQRCFDLPGAFDKL